MRVGRSLFCLLLPISSNGLTFYHPLKTTVPLKMDPVSKIGKQLRPVMFCDTFRHMPATLRGVRTSSTLQFHPRQSYQELTHSHDIHVK